jgi:hypothetical protein
LLPPELSFFVATEMALFCEFMHKVLPFHTNMQLNYQTTSTHQEHEERFISASDIQL